MSIIWTTWKQVPLWVRLCLSVSSLLLIVLTAFVASNGFLVLLCFWMYLRPFSFVHSDAAAKPFSFCLPGYRDSARVGILVDAVLIGLAYAAFGVRLILPEQSFSSIAAGRALMWFLLGFVISLLWAPPGFFTVVAPLDAVLSIAFAIGVMMAMWVVVWHSLLFWLVVALTGVVVCVCVWWRLRDARGVACRHRRIIKETMEKQAQIGVERTVPSWAGDLLLARAERKTPLGTWWCIWAGLYRAFGPVLCYWKEAVTMALVMSVVLGLAGRAVAEVAFASMGLIAAFVDPPARSTMLLPGGRRERHYATLVAPIATTLLLLVMAAGMAILSEIVAMRFGPSAERSGVRLGSAWLACVFVPWIFALKPCRFGPFRITRRSTPILLVILALLVFRRFVPDAQMRMFVYAVAGLCGWVLFLLVLKYACTDGCLAGSDVRAGERE